MYFLARDKLYETEKPYSLRFPPDGDLLQSNIKREKFGLTMQDIRKGEPPVLEKTGFEIMPMNSAMARADFDNEELVKTLYLQEVKEALMKHLSARHVHVMDFAVNSSKRFFPQVFESNSKRTSFDGGLRPSQYRLGRTLKLFSQRRWHILVSRSRKTLLINVLIYLQTLLSEKVSVLSR
jgi:hypothetical protein